MIASSMVCFMVAADEGQPWQFPSKCNAHDSLFDSEKLDVARVGAQPRPNFLQGLEDALFQAERMKPVQQQQTADDIISPAGGKDGSPGFARRFEVRQETLEPDPVQVEDRPEDRLRVERASSGERSTSRSKDRDAAGRPGSLCRRACWTFAISNLFPVSRDAKRSVEVSPRSSSSRGYTQYRTEQHIK